MSDRCEVAIVGSGFAGSLLARILAVLGYDVVLLERGTHPRFAIGESSTPLANLSLERLGTRYALADCYHLATHGRWLRHFPDLRRGLKRGFTFYRHHPHEPFADRGFDSERLLVAASPADRLADTHWLRADVDHHFVTEAVRAGVNYRDGANITSIDFRADGARLAGERQGERFAIRAGFVVDASGPGGFLARHLAIPSTRDEMETHSALLFSHFEGVASMQELVPGLPMGPYPDDWAAVHHVIDEGWLYSLRFDHGTTSAGFLVTPGALATLAQHGAPDPAALWSALLARYPTLAQLFASARPVFPIRCEPRIQHRLLRAAGERWAMMPHAFAFVDPLFSTGIAWGLLGVERLALAFESAEHGTRRPPVELLARYESLLAIEADQIDRLVAGAYEAMAHFDLFTAQAMLYFATVSFAEIGQRVIGGDAAAWNGFLGSDDAVFADLPRESLGKLRRMTHTDVCTPTSRELRDFGDWIAAAIAPRNVAGLADPARRNLYPVDLDLLIDRHALLGMSREQLIGALPALRGHAPEPHFAEHDAATTVHLAGDRSTLPPGRPSRAPGTPAPH